MSFFDRQGIPDSLLRESTNANQTDKESNTSDTEDDESKSREIEKFENDILLLKDCSLISVTSDQASFEMHRLVQLGTQEWLQAQGNFEHRKENCIQRLDRSFPEGTYENWKQCQLLFPHVQSTLMRQPVGKASMREWASLLHKAASFAFTSGNFVDCKKMANRAMKARKDLFGLNDIKTMDSSNMLGLTYSSGGRWKEAEELQLLVTYTCKQVLGSEHPDTLTSMAYLASTYRDQGRWKEAAELELQVMETRKQVLGLEHPETLTGMANLGSTYWDQGRWKEAKDLEVQVMETRKKVLGPEHPDTLNSMANLASTLRSLGDYEAALQLMAKCAEYRSQRLGPDHPSTLSSIAIWKEWQSQIETSPVKPAEPQIEIPPEEKTHVMAMEATARVSSIAGISKRQLLISLFVLAVSLVYALNRG